MDDVVRLHKLTEDWGSRESVELYLDRCQVDTPDRIVSAVWAHVLERRQAVRQVVDFGAGDGRFAHGGSYTSYIGYEIDEARCSEASLPDNAQLVSQCAFSAQIKDADVCIGNPPYVRNQDLPEGWRHRAASELIERTGVSLSGLANAWQYFFLLSLASTKSDGLVAIVIPYEWVSRPSAAALREYIRQNRWDVSVYRLVDDTFSQVLTTASITIIDKRSNAGSWLFFEESSDGAFRPLRSESGGVAGVVKYSTRKQANQSKVVARRGLSPGTQKVLTLTEGERVRSGLLVGRDVVPCVTSLRVLEETSTTLSEAVFTKKYRNTGAKCWLIRTDKNPSDSLLSYLNSVPYIKYQTSTCTKRECWWAFSMPEIPSLLVATGFRGKFPKIVTNPIGARAVGGVSGIYGVSQKNRSRFASSLRTMDLSESIVPHSNGLKKLEINQLNTLIRSVII